MTYKARSDGRSSVRQLYRRTEGSRSRPPAAEAPNRSAYSLVVIALVVIAVFGLFTGSAMSRTVSSSAQLLRDIQASQASLTQAYEAVSLATVTALDRDAGVASDNAVFAVVGQAHAKVAAFQTQMSLLPHHEGVLDDTAFGLTAHTVLRHIDSGSAQTAEAFLFSKLLSINDRLVDELATQHGLAVEGMLSAEASAERTTELAQTLLSVAAVAAALVVLLIKWKQDPTSADQPTAPVSHLRQVS